MNIFIIGQCTLHWGRMEFGNIGNYYIIEPFMRELHRVFPDAKIKTTMQLSDEFCKKENVSVVGMELYYGWTGNDLGLAKKEQLIAEKFNETGTLTESSPYIDEVMASDLVIDFSGDIWGDNANFLGDDRLEVGLIKDHIAKLLGKKVVMLAGSPGPFSNEITKQMAKDVYQKFDLITNRESISTKLLQDEGFDIDKTKSLACPAFLFQPATGIDVEELLEREGLAQKDRERPIIGFIICGWNFEVGPFDKWPRDDTDYLKFAEAIEMISGSLNAQVCLMSHSNGFDVPPAEFELKHGRDYPIIKQLERIVRDRGIATDVFALDGIYDAWQTKAIVGSFDMLVSGRVHAAVAGLSQNIPTIIIDYGHEPKAHKLLGFATVAGVQDYVVDPSKNNELIAKIRQCWGNRRSYKKQLEKNIPIVKETARQNFKLLKDLFDE